MPSMSVVEIPVPKPNPKRTGRPKRSTRNDGVAKIDNEVLAEAKMVAASRKISLAEYLSESLRPIVRRDLQSETGRRFIELPPKRKPKGGE